MTSRKEDIKQLIETWGGRFSSELGIDVQSGRPDEIFKWFLASILFGTRIRQDVAAETYREFARRNVLTPGDILETGWDGLVGILDAGGYVRYDFKTATKLLDVARMLNTRYGGNLNRLHEEARDERDVEARLLEFKGVGPVTANIFLRELRGIWGKADPLPGDLVIEAARDLGFTTRMGKDTSERDKILLELKKVWGQAGLPYHFSDFEAALIKYGINIRRTTSRTTVQQGN